MAIHTFKLIPVDSGCRFKLWWLAVPGDHGLGGLGLYVA